MKNLSTFSAAKGRFVMKVGKTPQKCVLFVKLMVFLGVVGTVIFCRKAGADDWPTYRYDNARSGAGTETVSPPLYLQWVFEPGHTPQPAWPVPAEEMPRTHGDNAFHVTVADGMAYFGSSVTNKVHAIDAAEGRIRWIFYTQGPVRFAPTIYEEKVYFGSDDGYVYCLSAKRRRTSSSLSSRSRIPSKR